MTESAPEEEWPTLEIANETTDDWELIASSDGEPAVVVVLEVHQQRPRSLSSSFSSPNLSRYDLLESVPEEDYSSKYHDDSSYDLVSGPRSVMSVASTLSFRDAILRQAASHDTAAHTEQQKTRQPTLRPFRVQPKFVVKPIQRCTKSTGDLPSLGQIEEDDDDMIGEDDAMEFYQRKSSGARSRFNGSKIRPDEAKRLQMTMHKKTLQRSKNGSG